MGHSVVTGNCLLDRHVLRFSIVHVARGEPRKKEVPGQLGILNGLRNTLCESTVFQGRLAIIHNILTEALEVGACTSLSLTPFIICLKKQVSKVSSRIGFPEITYLFSCFYCVLGSC